jgi:NADH-quinone oxidoreductase subunit N
MMAPISIDIAGLNLPSLLAMGIPLAAAMMIFVLDLLGKFTKHFYVGFSLIALLGSLFVILGYGHPEKGMFDVIVMDGLSQLAQIVIIVASILFIPLALTSKRFHEYTFAEFFALFLVMIVGFQFMVASYNLIFIFVALETASLALYVLIAMHNRNRSTEAAIKYFTMGAMAAGFYAFGSMLLYAATGSVEIDVIIHTLQATNYVNLSLVYLAIALIIGALGFKLSVVPFHTWTPDVYEGASAPLAGYMSVVPKIAGLVIAIRLFEPLIQSNLVWVRDMLLVAAVLSMTIGNVLALIQESVKRMLAYSSISHAGFVIAAIVVATDEATKALFLYWILFLFANLGAFTMLWISRHKDQKFHHQYDHPYSKFSGMILVAPTGAIIMAIFMLSLAGVPPFSLFFGKLAILRSVVDAGYIGLAIVMVLNSAIAAYYYLKLIVYMFLKDPRENDHTAYFKNLTPTFKLIVLIAATLSTLAIFYIEPLYLFIDSYITSTL